jgi:hypothetical protein
MFQADSEHERPHGAFKNKRLGSIGKPEKSLTSLTSKFMTLLQESPNGVLDLRSLVESIPIRQKRRVYDITNVLEGIGLIEKFSKNRFENFITFYLNLININQHM